ncbi:MAG: TonB-dependent receptor [Saprospiraceae bacterium]|nr:TonB-dependent receptor [Saprospiraceae bacterium]MDW8483199.1 TonB-dependent receptor [Saprospiraceae bacterium]
MLARHGRRGALAHPGVKSSAFFALAFAESPDHAQVHMTGDGLDFRKKFPSPVRARYWATLCGVAGFVLAAEAQTDSALLLPPAQVVAAAARVQPVGARVERLDSAQLAWHAVESAAEVLFRRSGFYIKSYGLGSLATTSVRGGSGSQTAVVWNGLPLQSPMLGQLDFALLPAFFTDEMAFQYGGCTAAWGSGAVGGALLLNNATRWYPGLHGVLRAGAGSFGWQQLSAALRYGRARWATATRLLADDAQNDFPFRPAPTLPFQRQSNARLRQQGFLQELFFRPRPEGATLALRLWRQYTHRQIPPTLTQRFSFAQQTDDVWRAMAHWRKPTARGLWEARAAYFDELNHYRDSLLRQDARNRFRTLMGELETSHHLSRRLSAQAALTYALTRAYAPAYGTEVQQQRLALFSAWTWLAKRWKAQADARVEQIDHRLAPLTPGLGVEWQISPSWLISTRLARHYRAPTLNDRYWRPGGNPDLRPENGWSQELGLTYQYPHNAWQWRFGLTAYQRRIRDWILWARQTGQLFFSPQNIAEVWSRGLEGRLHAAYNASWGQAQLTLGYDYTRSTNERPIASPRIEAGSQLFYVPLHQAFAELSAQWRGFQFVLFHRYTDRVVGLNEPVPAFRVGSLRIQYNWRKNAWSIGAYAHLENAWNAEYLVVERRPMPGRHYRAGVQLGF